MAFVMSLRGGVALRPTTDSHRQPRKASRSSKINLRSSGSHRLRLTATPSSSCQRLLTVICAATEEKEVKEKEKSGDELDAVTQKWGLEAGLWKAFTSKESSADGSKSAGSQAKDLLARYGSAYLATSISLSLVSFGLCYVLVNNGVDVPAVLGKIGIHASETGEKVGTVALAYAAHKAASPIRFPPTVALTPIVARWFGKKLEEASSENTTGDN